ncbi:hypothetical protein OH77DRAFT_1585244 [Trametes cingulata]|nr:hypothetical protein OH77DRAFT_1585244 [Trametes cingulata]
MSLGPRELTDADDAEHTLKHQMYKGLGDDPSVLINAAFALTTIGQLALLVLFLTLLFSSAVSKRNAMLLNVLAISFLGTIPHCLLMYAGMIYNPKPPTALCAAQAALLEGVQCMFAMVSLSLVVDLLVESQVVSFEATNLKCLRAALIALPYVTFVVHVSVVAAFGAVHPEQIRHMPNDLACTLHNFTFITTMQIVISAVVVLALSLMTYAVVHSIATRRHLPSIPTGVGWPRPRLLSFSQAARIVAFTCLQALLLVFSTVRTYVHSDGIRTTVIILQALMPLMTFGIVGTTSECCHLWKRAIAAVKLYPRSICPGKRHMAEPEKVPVEIHVTVERNYDNEVPIRIALGPGTRRSAQGWSKSLKDCLVRD